MPGRAVPKLARHDQLHKLPGRVVLPRWRICDDGVRRRAVLGRRQFELLGMCCRFVRLFCRDSDMHELCDGELLHRRCQRLH